MFAKNVTGGVGSKVLRQIGCNSAYLALLELLQYFNLKILNYHWVLVESNTSSFFPCLPLAWSLFFQKNKWMMPKHPLAPHVVHLQHKVAWRIIFWIKSTKSLVWKSLLAYKCGNNALLENNKRKPLIFID